MSGLATSGGATGGRRRLAFGSEDDVIAEVERLRSAPHRRVGNWTLPQACWHLDASVKMRMAAGPFPPNTPEQDARRAMFEQIMHSGELPDGIAAPDAMVPPEECGDEAVDAFVATMRRFKAFRGPVAPHRIFGHLGDADARRLNLIHCARHLGYFVPAEAP